MILIQLKEQIEKNQKIKSDFAYRSQFLEEPKKEKEMVLKYDLDLEKLLTSLNMQEYIEMFEKKDITSEVFLDLSENEF